MSYGDDYRQRCKQSLLEEIIYFLNHAGTIEDVIEVLHDAVKDGEQND